MLVTPANDAKTTSSALSMTSLRLDAGSLDDRPPFVDLRLVERQQRLRRALLGRENVLGEIDQLLLDPRIGERLGGGVVELGNDRLRCALGRPQRMPEREVETRQTRFVGGRNFRR